MSLPAFESAGGSSRQRDGRRFYPAAQASSWQSFLGVSPTISASNIAAFFLHSSSSILFLVFLNSTQPFLISQLGETKKQGSLSGTLVFSDELLSMFLVLFWGSLADIIGTKIVAVIGYCFIAIALLSYTFAQVPWPDLLFCRLTFAIGGSAVTAMLSGILNSYSASHEEWKDQEVGVEEQPPPTETSPLLETLTSSPVEEVSERPNRHGRLAAVTGLMTGFGALIAVFFLLRLPTYLASIHDKHAPSRIPTDGGDEAIRRGTKEAFYIVSALSLSIAGLLSIGLKMDRPDNQKASLRRRLRDEVDEEANEEVQEGGINASSTRKARRQRLKKRLETRSIASNHLKNLFIGTFTGFKLASKDSSLLLGYLSGGLARACTIATTVFIPILVTRFFYTSGLCSTLPSPDVPPSELYQQCRKAFTVASILSGVIQLVALLLSPLIGYLCEALSPAWTLLIASSIGTASFLIFSLALPNDGDPTTTIAWIAAIGIGFCQIANIVASLTLCAKTKTKLSSIPFPKTNDDQNSIDDSQERRPSMTTLGGSIAGAYSATGGLFILIVSKLGGSLSDLYAPAAFLLLAFMAALTTTLSLVVVIQERRAKRLSAATI